MRTRWTGRLGGLGLLHLPELVRGGLHQRAKLGSRQVVDAPSRPVHDGAPHLVIVDALLGGDLEEPPAQLLGLLGGSQPLSTTYRGKLSQSRFTVISLGGGVQSSVMALMANEGEFGRLPDCAIFADTRWEPPSIYEHLTWLRDRLSFPLYVVDNGRSLREDVKALTNHSGSRNYVDIPVYLKGRDGEGDGIGRRQCTDNYKIRPIRRRIREMLGLMSRHRVPAGTTVELWPGISTDEAIRVRTSRDRWMTNRYPLIEAGMSRSDCMDWWAARYDRPLERSACVACPFQSRHRWVETKRRWPVRLTVQPTVCSCA